MSRRGPKSPFGVKQPPNPAVSLTPLAKKIVAGNVARTAMNASNVFEYLIRRYGGPALDADLRAIHADMLDEDRAARDAAGAVA